MPKGGSHAIDYNDLVSCLDMDMDMDIVAIEHPGEREVQADDLTTTVQIASRNLQVLKDYGYRDVYLGGQSIGAVLAFEMARLSLNENCVNTKGLALLDMYAPVPENRSFYQMDAYSDLAGKVVNLVKMIGAVIRIKPHPFIERERLEGLSEQAIMTVAVQWFRNAHFTFDEVGDEVIEDFIRNTTRIEHVVSHERRYVFPFQTVLFKAEDRPLEEDKNLPEDLGWSALIEGELGVITVPGDHITISRTGFVESLSQHMMDLFGLGV